MECGSGDRVLRCPYAASLAGGGSAGLSDLIRAGGDPTRLFWQFHGPNGIVPLKNFEAQEAWAQSAPALPSGCPFSGAASAAAASPAAAAAAGCPHMAVLSASNILTSNTSVAAPQRAADASLLKLLEPSLSDSGADPSAAVPDTLSLAAAPFASISFRMPFGFGFGNGHGPRRGGNGRRRDPRDPKSRFRQDGEGGRGAGASGGKAEGPGAGAPEPTNGVEARGSNPSNGGGHGTNHSGGTPAAGGAAVAAAGEAGASGGRCPMRRFYEPAVAALTAIGALAPKMQLHCPEPIVRARALLAKTPLASSIRRQVLPKKLLAVGALSLLCNVPFGMLREHTEKFSWQWIVVVHSSIPFVGMLRKATILPKYSIAMTIAAAIVGQAIGASLERNRLQYSAGHTEAEPLPLILSDGGSAAPAHRRDASRSRAHGHGEIDWMSDAVGPRAACGRPALVAGMSGRAASAVKI